MACSASMVLLAMRGIVQNARTFIGAVR